VYKPRDRLLRGNEPDPVLPPIVCAKAQGPPPRRGQGRDSLASRRMGHGGRRTQRSTGAQAQATATCRTGLLNPDASWHGEAGRRSPSPDPTVCMPHDEPRGPPSCIQLCPLRHVGTRPSHPCRGRSDACAATAALWVHRGCPLTPSCPPGTHRPLWAARDRSGRGLPHPVSREGVRGLPDPFCRRRPWRNAHTPLRASFRDTSIGFSLWRSWRRISRSAPIRRDGSNFITGACSLSP